MYLKILKAKNNQLVKFGIKKKNGFNLVDTGVNEKYAYGVKTRTVNMGRNNQEGTNAFLYYQSMGNYR